MKRLFSFCLVVSLSLLLASCGREDTASGAVDQSAALIVAKQQAIALLESNEQDNTSVNAKAACTKIATITSGKTIKGKWKTRDCSATSQVFRVASWLGYAKFYTFSVTKKSKVTIVLTSPGDPVLILRKGKNTSGTYKRRDDDGGRGFNSKIAVTLTAGTYTIEAASLDRKGYSPTGSFDLRLTCKNCGTTGGDTLTVTTPNGGESWKPGKTYTIRWNKGNAGAFVKIQLLRSGKAYKMITGRTTNDGKHRWRIPASLAAGSAFKIKITSKTDSKTTDSSDSEFTISKAGGGDTKPKVTTPNGGESWEPGKRYTIKWDKGNAGSFVRIFLQKSGKRSKTIAQKTANDGTHPWTVPTTIASGSAYKIRVQSVNNKTQYDDSDANFTIGSTLEVTSPNGGESWNAGSAYTITWDEGNAGSYVKIYLYNSGTLDRTISTYASNDGSYSWSIPSTQTGSSLYKIRVRSYSNSSIYDESDSNFSIEEEELPSGDYQYLYNKNAYHLGGYTLRWESKTIQVSGASGSWRDAANRWPTVRFSYVGSPPSSGNGIEIIGYVDDLPSDSSGRTCGQAQWSYWNSGVLASCTIKMNPTCDEQSQVMTHEIGHCIGFLKHTTDGGLMDATTEGSNDITSPVSNMISLLYSLDPGTNINSELSRNSAAMRRARKSRYDPLGRTLYSGSSYFMENGDVIIVRDQ